MGKSILDFAVELGRLMSDYSIGHEDLANIMLSRDNGHGPRRVPVRAEASDAEQVMTKVEPKITNRIQRSKLTVIEAPAEMKDPPDLFDGLSSDVPKGLPGLEGTIKPAPKIRVKRDTVINRVRLWILQDVPKGALITVKGVNRMFNLDHATSCSIIDSLRADRAIRRKRNITGGFQRGAYVRMGSTCEATLRRRLRGKCVR